MKICRYTLRCNRFNSQYNPHNFICIFHYKVIYQNNILYNQLIMAQNILNIINDKSCILIIQYKKFMDSSQCIVHLINFNCSRINYIHIHLHHYIPDSYYDIVSRLHQNLDNTIGRMSTDKWSPSISYQSHKMSTDSTLNMFRNWNRIKDRLY